MSVRRALFRCDASTVLGGGHVMRCLTLARALQARGWQVVFAINDGAESVVPGLREVECHSGFVMEAADAARLRSLASPMPDLLVIDHYRSTPEFEMACRDIARQRLVIDDFSEASLLAEARRDCDLLLNPNIGAVADGYRGRVPPEAMVLAGARFALLRAEFAQAGAARMASRREPDAVARVALSFGFTDAGKITARVVRLLLEHAVLQPGLALDAIMGPKAEGMAEIRALRAIWPTLAVHVDPQDMADTLASADLAIGAAGQSSYERCCLGLPSIAVAVVDNQEFLVTELAKAGAARAINLARPDWEKELILAWRTLADDPQARIEMAHAARKVCDGQGARRAVEAIESRL